MKMKKIIQFFTNIFPIYRKSRLKLYTKTESVMRLETNHLVLQLRYATKILIGAFLKNRPTRQASADSYHITPRPCDVKRHCTGLYF